MTRGRSPRGTTRREVATARGEWSCMQYDSGKNMYLTAFLCPPDMIYHDLVPRRKEKKRMHAIHTSRSLLCCVKAFMTKHRL